MRDGETAGHNGSVGVVIGRDEKKDTGHIHPILTQFVSGRESYSL